MIESWFLGNQHGTAVADVLFGDYNPGGKAAGDVPAGDWTDPTYYDHRSTGRPPDSTQKYNVEVSGSFVDAALSLWLWVELYDLRYTNLRLSAATIRAGDPLSVSIDVTNTGDRPGDEVVQLYIRDDVASVAEPVKIIEGISPPVASTERKENRDVHARPRGTQRFTIAGCDAWSSPERSRYLSGLTLTMS